MTHTADGNLHRRNDVYQYVHVWYVAQIVSDTLVIHTVVSGSDEKIYNAMREAFIENKS